MTPGGGSRFPDSLGTRPSRRPKSRWRCSRCPVRERPLPGRWRASVPAGPPRTRGPRGVSVAFGWPRVCEHSLVAASRRIGKRSDGSARAPRGSTAPACLDPDLVDGLARPVGCGATGPRASGSLVSSLRNARRLLNGCVRAASPGCPRPLARSRVAGCDRLRRWCRAGCRSPRRSPCGLSPRSQGRARPQRSRSALR
jgi:hypothetical protein